MTEPVLKLVPVKTRIVTQKDNIVDIIAEYGKDKIGPDDVVTVAESVVAITQGRMKRHEDIRSSLFARALNRFVPQKGSLSSIYGMQALMDEEGTFKVVFTMFLGMVAKLLGRGGLFYELAGKQARLIDDVTGTMPPFDKYMVYGPENPEGVAQSIKDRLGCYGAAVADINDLKCSYILGVSGSLNAQELAQILIDNPFGNASQQTPIVVIKNYAKIVQTKNQPAD